MVSVSFPNKSFDVVVELNQDGFNFEVPRPFKKTVSPTPPCRIVKDQNVTIQVSFLLRRLRRRDEEAVVGTPHAPPRGLQGPLEPLAEELRLNDIALFIANIELNETTYRFL